MGRGGHGSLITIFCGGRVVSFPDAPPTTGKERLVTIDAKLGPNDVIYPAVERCGMRNHNQLGF